MQALLELFALLYVANVVTWSIVSALVWGITRVFRDGAARRRVERERPPEPQSREAAVYTLTRSLVALTVVQTVIFSLTPPSTPGPVQPGSIVLQVLAAMIVFDFAFYLAHRLLHHPRLWALHDKHHQYRIVDLWVRNADHVGQVFVVALFAAPVGLFLTDDLAKGIYFLLSTTWNVLQHCGYEVFPRWRWLSRVVITPTHHSMHHTERDCNFGYFFPFWDDVLGTTHPAYRARFLGEATASTAASTAAVDA
jgi:sterol desaturase/sphingolipid hydroxylase (fatty acid hydroxylase superfamily)